MIRSDCTLKSCCVPKVWKPDAFVQRRARPSEMVDLSVGIEFNFNVNNVVDNVFQRELLTAEVSTETKDCQLVLLSALAFIKKSPVRFRLLRRPNARMNALFVFLCREVPTKKVLF